MLAACSSPKGEPEIVYLPYPLEDENFRLNIDGCFDWRAYFELKNVTRKQSNDSILGPHIAQMCDSAIQKLLKERGKYIFKGRKYCCEHAPQPSGIECKDNEYIYIFIPTIKMPRDSQTFYWNF